MAKSVDDIMARCPLKQHIRDALWVPFIRKVIKTGTIDSYLTLYSPPMMDIKHLHRSKLLDFDGERFGGVVAVTYQKQHYADAMRSSSGRPQLLLFGDVDTLLTSEATAIAEQLRSGFPFQVVNLDYCNSLFDQANRLPLSEHLSAINEIVRQQQRARSGPFVLFLTSRAERRSQARPAQFSSVFLKDLTRRLDDNVANNQPFRKKYENAFGQLSGQSLQNEQYTEFIQLGVAKLVAQILGQHGFEVSELDACVLVRDKRGPARWLLHLAFYVRPSVPPRASTLKALGKAKRFYSERKLASFVERVGSKEVSSLSERADYGRLQRRHGKRIAEVAAKTLDLPIPEPQNRDA